MPGTSRSAISDYFTIALTALITSAGAVLSCDVETASLRGDWGRVDVRVEVADDPQERSLGLMHRESMPKLSGMLFIYETPQRVAFWMRNTLIPLDMLFIDPDGRVAAIHENAIPLDETAIPGGDGRLAVLEINGGLARQLGITEGSELRHPGLPQDIALWPCDAG